MPDISLTGPESLALLRENASRLADLTDGVKHSQLHTAPEVGEWSPNEILAHMRACCDVYASKLAKHERIHVRQIEHALTRAPR